MPDVVVKVEGLDRLDALAADKEFVAGPLRDFLARSAFAVERFAKEKAPVDTGRLRTSVATVLGGTSAVIGPTIFYAPFVEYGTRPHFPPPVALQPWAKRHGFGPGGAFALARAIARRGTRAHPFMRPAAKDALPMIRQNALQLKRDIEERWGRG